ncbi:hypothetical protein BC831DRAFT_466198 [Entophlyctis helioformis]|nr:hypothetical protein BC831DRAFT_466198 [Entophlyctis helioformis]
MASPGILDGHAAVVALDMQNDFLQPDGFLKAKFVHVGELERSLSNLLAVVRSGTSTGNGSSSHVVWVRSVYDDVKRDPKTVQRPAGERYARAPLNSGLLAGSLAGSSSSPPCCEPNTPGSDFHPDVARLISHSVDTVMDKGWLSAFTDTSLEADLKARGIQRIVLCGNLSTSSVLATAADAFFLGFQVLVLRDCLGWTSWSKHLEALATIDQFYGRVVSLADLIGKPAAHVYGSGDSRLLLDVLPPDLGATAFSDLRSEVAWQEMLHRGGPVPRLVAVQGTVDVDPLTGVRAFPVYRHPADEQPVLTPFTPTVDRIRAVIEQSIGQSLNHVLIQLYRDGSDFISEHSDKTLDVVRGTAIVNMSLGAERVMVLHTKRDSAGHTGQPGQRLPKGTPRKTQRFALPHNSLFVMGPETNAKWLHGIAQDKQHQHMSPHDEATASDATAAETGADGSNTGPSSQIGYGRISLTFRSIGTFSTSDGLIYGQGATGKTRETAKKVTTDAVQVESMIIGFSLENQTSEFDWDGAYGAGFDVIACSPPAVPAVPEVPAAGDGPVE